MSYDVDKVKKIVRLLESDQDGEVASAARMLVRMAKKESHNLDEMMAAAYGRGAGVSSGGSKDYSRGYRAGLDAQSKIVSELKAEIDCLKATKPEARPAASSDSKFERLRSITNDQNLIDQLTEWEAEFVDDMVRRGPYYHWSERQESVVDRILAKFVWHQNTNQKAWSANKAYAEQQAQNNGDEDAFWKA